MLFYGGTCSGSRKHLRVQSVLGQSAVYDGKDGISNSFHLTCTAKSINLKCLYVSHTVPKPSLLKPWQEPTESLHGQHPNAQFWSRVSWYSGVHLYSNTCWTHWGEWLSVQAAYRLTVPCLHVQTALLFKHWSVKLSNLVKVSCQSQKEVANLQNIL